MVDRRGRRTHGAWLLRPAAVLVFGLAASSPRTLSMVVGSGPPEPGAGRNRSAASEPIGAAASEAQAPAGAGPSAAAPVAPAAQAPATPVPAAVPTPAPPSMPTPASVPSPAPSAVAAAAPAFPAMESIFNEYRGLRPGPSYDAAGLEFHVGHLRVNFRTGTLTAILTSSGKETGFIYEGGEGHYLYSTADPGDLQTMGKNIQKFVNTAAHHDGTLTEEMSGCIFVGSAPLLRDVLEAAAPAAKATSGGAASRLMSFLHGLDNADVGLDHEAALAILDGGSARTVYGEIDGQVVDPGYLYDPAVRQEERLLLFRTVRGDRFFSIVSRQSLGSDNGRSAVVMTHLDYTLNTPNNHDADVKAVQSFNITRPSFRVQAFDLINHADEAANNWVSTTRAVEVRSVKTAEGRELPFSHRYHQVLVEFPEAPAVGSSLTLTFDLLLHSLDTRGDEWYLVGAGTGFPDPWGWNSISATCHWKVTTKKPYRSFAGGTVVARREEGDTMFLEATVDSPTDMPRLIAGKFDMKEEERNGLKVRVGIYGSASAHAVSSYTDTAYTLLDVYGKALVPYPRKELDVMEFKYLGFYQSPPGLVMVPSEPPGGASVVESRTADYHLRTFMHEMAHQWFGNMVVPKSWAEDNWISESIAEYLGALVYSKGAKDPKDAAQKMQMAIDGWHRDADMSRDSVSIAQASYLRGDWTERETYIQLLYGKGPLVVRMLHSTIGDERFWRLLQSVLTKYNNKAISTDEFGREASAIVGQDMTWFFNQWIKQPGIPDLDVAKSLSKGGGKSTLTGHLKQKDAAHFKMLLLPFVYETGGSRAVKLVLMDKPEMDFTAELPADAANVVLDPGKNNLVYYH